MTITCNDSKSFMDCIAGLVERGLTFDACYDSLTVRLSGGY